MPEFKFKVGDIVMFKTGVADAVRRCGIGDLYLPNLYMVVERHTQECPGGIQIHYTLNDKGQFARFNEIELCLIDEFDAVEARAKAEAYGKSVLSLLNTAKNQLVANGDFDNAAKIRDVTDALKKLEKP